MTILIILEWLISTQTVVTAVFLLVFAFGLLWSLIRG